MCNIIVYKIHFYEMYKHIKNDIDDIVNTLSRRGRDNFSACIISGRKYSFMNSNSINEFKEKLNDTLHHNIDILILHSRAIPETESYKFKDSNIYNKKRFIIAHHGIIPNAETINPNIVIDSEVLEDIYHDIDYRNLKGWFINNIKKYPRATTEILFDKLKYKLIVATTFMPLYKKENNTGIVYTTDESLYRDLNIVKPYTIELIL